ncbi:MAG TPA: phytanoyl-CoA dioxygenase family protein [Afifellaceae bacterium]|nr:phytanoyl-CoA dioxygenase family protein [Afifellaceae bacterium]
MSVLSEEEIERFWRDGAITVENAVPGDQLAALRREFDGWVEESRGHEAAYGEAMDGRPRFDLQPGHSAAHPALRRVQAPSEISEAYFNVMADSRMTDMVADLIGPNVKHHHNKINSKLPGAATEVKWHQDFPYTPHTNTDLVTALLMVDEVTDENGPLEIAPGSHRGPLHSLWHDGRFTGAIADETAERIKSEAVRCLGPAGSVCLMHTCVAHGSAPNLSDLPRTLFIAVYSAADAMPCCPNPVPNRHEGLIVRGEDPHVVRATAYTVAVPEFPKGASFFTQQSETERRAP